MHFKVQRGDEQKFPPRLHKEVEAHLSELEARVPNANISGLRDLLLKEYERLLTSSPGKAAGQIRTILERQRAGWNGQSEGGIEERQSVSGEEEIVLAWKEHAKDASFALRANGYPISDEDYLQRAVEKFRKVKEEKLSRKVEPETIWEVACFDVWEEVVGAREAGQRMAKMKEYAPIIIDGVPSNHQKKARDAYLGLQAHGYTKLRREDFAILVQEAHKTLLGQKKWERVVSEQQWEQTLFNAWEMVVHDAEKWKEEG